MSKVSFLLIIGRRAQPTIDSATTSKGEKYAAAVNP